MSMTKDDILQALRLTAMGRAGHPLQEELAENLERVFAVEVQALPVVEPVEKPLAVAEPIENAAGNATSDQQGA
jgi:hypothetical protein